jgi:predicted acyltransferase
MNSTASLPGTAATAVQQSRLLSLDFMRGLIMVLLVLESTGMWEHLFKASEGTPFSALFIQFFHHNWNGLRFWDLIQPGFMFMAGVALAYSLSRQEAAGMSWNESFLKTLKRSAWLFFWGVLDYAVRRDGLSFELWDVLTQLSFTTLVAFLILRWSMGAQIAFSLGLLILTEILYRFINVPGFDQTFVDQHNFGNYMDLVLMNKINDGGWVAINCIPTAAHTIWGAVIGKLLMSDKTAREKIRWMLIAGTWALVLGYGLDLTLTFGLSSDLTITPIIKRIATSSFTLASGGWCILALCLCYWWIDVKEHRKHLRFFVVVGMNSLFIYLFIEIVASRWFNGYIGAITGGLLEIIHLPHVLIGIITSCTIFALEWSMCNFLYKKKIFFKI